VEWRYDCDGDGHVDVSCRFRNGTSAFIPSSHGDACVADLDAEWPGYLGKKSSKTTTMSTTSTSRETRRLFYWEVNWFGRFVFFEGQNSTGMWESSIAGSNPYGPKIPWKDVCVDMGETVETQSLTRNSNTYGSSVDSVI
jgi:hypothetical protein